MLVKGDRIPAIGERLEAPQVRRVDLGEMHLYPGLVALNTGLGLREVDAVRATVHQREVGEFTPEVTSWMAVNPDSELLPVARGGGIAYFEPVPARGVVAGQSSLLSVWGWTVRDMTIRAPLALHV